MKKLLVFFLIILFSAILLGQVFPEEAIPVIESKGIMSSVDESLLTYSEFKNAVEKAFPGKGNLISGTGEVLRADFAVAMIEVLGLKSESESYEEICTTALDEWEAPKRPGEPSRLLTGAIINYLISDMAT